MLEDTDGIVALEGAAHSVRDLLVQSPAENMLEDTLEGGGAIRP